MGVWHITLPNLGCLGDSTPVRVRDFLLPLQAATPKLFEYNEYMASNHPITVSYHTCPILMHESTVSNVVLLIGGPTDIGGWSAPSPKATNVVQGWYFQVQFIIFGKSVAYPFFWSSPNSQFSVYIAVETWIWRHAHFSKKKFLSFFLPYALRLSSDPLPCTIDSVIDLWSWSHTGTLRSWRQYGE